MSCLFHHDRGGRRRVDLGWRSVCRRRPPSPPDPEGDAVSRPHVTREAWLTARGRCWSARRSTPAERRPRPGAPRPAVGPIEADYRFDTDGGHRSPSCSRRSQLLVYHFMFGPIRPPAARAARRRRHVRRSGRPPREPRRDLALRLAGPARRAGVYRRRMGWRFRWVSSSGSASTSTSGCRSRRRHRRTPATIRSDPRGASGGPSRRTDQRVRPRGRRRVPHVLGVRPRLRRADGRVPAARSCAEGTERGRSATLLVPAQGRVRGLTTCRPPPILAPYPVPGPQRPIRRAKPSRSAARPISEQQVEVEVEPVAQLLPAPRRTPGSGRTGRARRTPGSGPPSTARPSFRCRSPPPPRSRGPRGPRSDGGFGTEPIQLLTSRPMLPVFEWMVKDAAANLVLPEEHPGDPGRLNAGERRSGHARGEQLRLAWPKKVDRFW